MKITPSALSPTPTSLRVLFTIEIAGAQHVHTLSIPWEWMLDSDVLAGMDRTYRRTLLGQWSDEPLPLWQ